MTHSQPQSWRMLAVLRCGMDSLRQFKESVLAPKQSMAVAVVCCCMISGSFAGPLNPSLVPDDAVWVVHLDVQAALESPVGAAWLAAESEATAAEKPATPASQQQAGGNDPQSTQPATGATQESGSSQGKKRGSRRGMVERMLRTFGLDISKEVKSITVVGLANSQDTGLVFLTTDIHADRMGQRLLESECELYEMDRTRPGWVIHRWKRGGRSFLAAVHSNGKAPDDRLVILAETPLQLEAAIAILGERTVQENLNRLPRVSAREGSILYAAAADMNLDHERRPSATILREARSLVIDVGMMKGEDGSSRMYGNATIATADEASAQQVKEMIKGISSLLLPSLPEQDAQTKTLVAEMLEGVGITTHKDRCVVESSHDSKTVGKVAELFFAERVRRFRESKGSQKAAVAPVQDAGEKKGEVPPPDSNQSTTKTEDLGNKPG